MQTVTQQNQMIIVAAVLAGLLVFIVWIIMQEKKLRRVAPAKARKPRDYTMVAIAIPFAIALLTELPGCYRQPAYTPMDSYIDNVIEHHNMNCQYEDGECPEILCSHYHKVN